MSSNKIISILIVDSHPMIRQGITKMLLSKIVPYQFRVLEAEDGSEAISKLQYTQIDLAILDYMLPENDGSELIKTILQAQPCIRIMIMFEITDLLNVIKTRNIGASGFVLKTIQTFELLSAVGEVLKGKHYYSAAVANKIIQQDSTDQKESAFCPRKISPKEHIVLRLIVLGKTNKEIARELFIGERTVETHRKNLMYKLQVRNAAALIRVGYEQQLLP